MERGQLTVFTVLMSSVGRMLNLVIVSHGSEVNDNSTAC